MFLSCILHLYCWLPDDPICMPAPTVRITPGDEAEVNKMNEPWPAKTGVKAVVPTC